MDKIDDTDRIWNRDEIRARIEDIYFKVQEAWTKRDQNIVKDCMINIKDKLMNLLKKNLSINLRE